MNTLKGYINKDNTMVDDDYENETFVMPEDIKQVIPDKAKEETINAIDEKEKKTEEKEDVANAVSVKLVQPKDASDALVITDTVKKGNIVIMDISTMEQSEAVRMITFLTGASYVMDGEMIRTNRNTIVMAPAGVDVSGFAEDDEDEDEEAEEETAEEEV